MRRQRFLLASACLSAAALSGAIVALHGCSGETTGEQDQAAATPVDGVSTPISALPFVDAASSTQLLGELLSKQTALGETTALQVRLPPPTNQELASSLVR